MTPTLRRVLVLVIIAAAPAIAGSLDHGNWSPSGCGAEPIAPSGLNLSSTDAYKESIKWIKTYQDKYQKYSDCMIGEANADTDAINDYVRGRQHRAQEFFDKVNQDSKRAQAVLSSGSATGGSSGRNRAGSSSPGPQ